MLAVHVFRFLIYIFILSLYKIVNTNLRLDLKQRYNISPIKSDLIKWHDLLSYVLLVSAADLLKI